MRNSFVEISARKRAFSLLDDQEGIELLGPFANLISPHLMKQNIVPESDDGIILVRGKMNQKDVLMISIEGTFQGGGIGEIGGAKISASLELVLKENQNGRLLYPILLLDTGGVRLQEANYGLLSISEIQNMIVALKEYVPVIGVIPGIVGSFGGMSITSALLSYLIVTKKARIGLNGPEVIEQEAGIEEFDASDKALIWKTIGAKQRLATGCVDELVVDDIDTIKQAIVKAMAPKKEGYRSEQIDFYLSLLEKIDSSKPLEIAQYNQLYKENTSIQHKIPEASEGKNDNQSLGKTWFSAFTGIKNPVSPTKTVLYANKKIQNKEIAFLTIIPDKRNRFSRAQKGEMGLMEGFTLAKTIQQIISEDQEKAKKRAIVAIVDVPSQAYGYNEELIGIHMSLASSVEQYAKARQKGHAIITLIVGNAISGGFLAHGLQSNYILALNDSAVNVQAMSKESASRITQRTIQEIEAAAEEVPAIGYDIHSFYQLGAVYQLIDDLEINQINAILVDTINQAENGPRDLSFRYQSKLAKENGRKATIEVRKKLKKEWK
ncbi:biotin-independent malonate decarboxylase subunit beta [Listeria sp. PSOL-1]|uniref:biotin-independent malonate decarboxylase subunit beta n=1 Tax=Listeria sp. PSOL-1 TaxID=1844999 RepID=UPI0013D44602|nr:biotin-independent malonate decarboxylase subunit beta [Listeria sp. PSOL-1]